jgi:hypothetical protein
MAALKPRAPRVAALASLLLLPLAAQADAGWFESGDVVLRNDLLVLNDAGVIRLPVNQWPMPKAAVAWALGNAKEHAATNAAVMLALERIRARVSEIRRMRLRATASGGDPGLWREFSTPAREEGEIGARAGYDGERFSAALSVTGAVNPADDKEVRLDGSHATVQLGNWLISANALDRWWGPGHQGSLILSNNARPMPNLVFERAEPRPFKSPLLSWLGPYRFSFGIGQMETHREDIDRPLFMAWRVVVMPFKDIELGFSRTAQFCGAQLECNLDVFGNMLAGNDNLGFDTTPETEPGNQMAGFDIRWNSPIGNWPYAVYSQMIGEDESSYLPAKYLSQFGVETWKPFASGGLLQTFAEYASTTASGNSSGGPYYGSAYNQGRFNVEGYRYYHRVIGYTSDRDAENWSVGGTYTKADGDLWSATLRKSRLNRDDFNDVNNTVSSVPATYLAAEFGWKGHIAGEVLTFSLGVQSIEPAGEGAQKQTDPYGFISWHHEFAP